jgi:hypothetical protein
VHSHRGNGKLGADVSSLGETRRILFLLFPVVFTASLPSRPDRRSVRMWVAGKISGEVARARCNGGGCSQNQPSYLSGYAALPHEPDEIVAGGEETGCRAVPSCNQGQKNPAQMSVSILTVTPRARA